MLTLQKIAITGGLSCGKSSACHFFKEFGSYTINADEIVHQLLSSNTKLIQEITSLLGDDITENHQINRSRMAKKVFNNPQLLRSLENILHPIVYDEIERQYQRVAKEQSAPLFIAEIPLLYETGNDRFFDKTIVVVADEKVCKERFQQKTALEAEEYDKRSARMLSLKEKALKADYVIKNDGTLAQMRDRVKNIYDLLKKTS